MEAVKKTKAKTKKIALEECSHPCHVERGMRVIGGKWKGSILWHLKDGPVRFNELSRKLVGASKKMVNYRLKEMEDLGLLKRKVISTKPIAVTYEITDFGRSALGVLEMLKDWSEEHMS